jgi:hypothetical protein
MKATPSVGPGRRDHKERTLNPFTLSSNAKTRKQPLSRLWLFCCSRLFMPDPCRPDRPRQRPRWVRLYVNPVRDQWAAVIVADTVDPPRPGEGKGLRCFGDTAAEATAVALRYLGRCTERNLRWCAGGTANALMVQAG